MSYYDLSHSRDEKRPASHHDSLYSQALERLVQAAIGEEKPQLLSDASVVQFLLQHAKAHPEFPGAHEEDWSMMTSGVFLSYIRFGQEDDRREVVLGLDKVRIRLSHSVGAVEVY